MGDMWEIWGDHLHDGKGGHAHGGQLLRQPRAVAAAHLIRVRVGVGVQVRVGVRVWVRVWIRVKALTLTLTLAL